MEASISLQNSDYFSWFINSRSCRACTLNGLPNSCVLACALHVEQISRQNISWVPRPLTMRLLPLWSVKKSSSVSSSCSDPLKGISTNVLLCLCDLSNIIYFWVHKNFQFYFFVFSDARIHEQVLRTTTKMRSFVWGSVIVFHIMLSLRASYVPHHSFTFPCTLCTLPFWISI